MKIGLNNDDLTSGGICFPAAGLRSSHSLNAAAKAENTVVSDARNPKRQTTVGASGTGLRRRESVSLQIVCLRGFAHKKSLPQETEACG